MWIETLFEKLTCFFPRPIIIRPDEGGFRQTPKLWRHWPLVRKDSPNTTWTKELKPGNWYWLIPLLMEHLVIPIKTQPKDIRVQSARTSDGIDIAVGGAIKYYVASPIKAILEVHDYDGSLQTMALLVIQRYVRKHTLTELEENIDELETKLLDALRKEASGWGLKIQDVGITDIGKCNNLRLLCDNIFIGN